MSFLLKLWQLWVVGLAGWINQQQQDVTRVEGAASFQPWPTARDPLTREPVRAGIQTLP